jgi:hypothetical protein
MIFGYRIKKYSLVDRLITALRLLKESLDTHTSYVNSEIDEISCSQMNKECSKQQWNISGIGRIYKGVLQEPDMQAVSLWEHYAIQIVNTSRSQLTRKPYSILLDRNTKSQVSMCRKEEDNCSYTRVFSSRN